MRKLIAFLALSTSALAVTSIYLWTELREARDMAASPNRPATTTSLQGAPATQSQHGADAASPPNTSSQGAATSTDVGAQERQRLLEEDFRNASRRALAQLSDPTMRAQILEEWKEANLPNKPKYVRYLGISEAEAERLIDVLADGELARREAFARCALQQPCDYNVISRETSEAQQTALSALLGAEKLERFEQYTYSGIERQMVAQFLRDKIPAGSQLSEGQSEQFVSALADERRAVEAEIKQRGLEPFSYPMEGVAFTFQSNPFVEDVNSGELLKEAADYNRRIHARAKSILTPQQLTAFEQMQEAAIVGIKYWTRQQERNHATRNAASGESR